MEIIYWIQRLDIINALGWMVFGVAVTGMIVFTIISSIEADTTYSEEKEKMWINRRAKCLKCGLWVAIVSFLIGLFVPTSSEVYMIYGVGGTIDYIKGNDTAKQLPDKVINALDAWVDKQINDNDKDK